MFAGHDVALSILIFALVALASVMLAFGMSYGREKKLPPLREVSQQTPAPEPVLSQPLAVQSESPPPVRARPPLEAPHTPIPRDSTNVPSVSTVDEFALRVRVGKQYRTGALRWALHGRVDECTTEFQSVETRLRKIVRDCSKVRSKQAEAGAGAAQDVLRQLAAAQIGMMRLRQAIDELDPMIQVELSLLPAEEDTIRDAKGDLLCGVTPRHDS